MSRSGSESSMLQCGSPPIIVLSTMHLQGQTAEFLLSVPERLWDFRSLRQGFMSCATLGSSLLVTPMVARFLQLSLLLPATDLLLLRVPAMHCLSH